MVAVAHLGFWGVLILLFLLYAQNNHYQMSWYGVWFFPMTLSWTCLCISWYYRYYETLRESHTVIHNRLFIHLICSWVLLVIFFLMYAYWREIKYGDKTWVVLLPAEIFFISLICMFMYMLPGLLDPENLIDRRVLFYFIMYTVAALIVSVTCSCVDNV